MRLFEGVAPPTPPVILSMLKKFEAKKSAIQKTGLLGKARLVRALSMQDMKDDKDVFVSLLLIVPSLFTKIK